LLPRRLLRHHLDDICILLDLIPNEHLVLDIDSDREIHQVDEELEPDLLPVHLESDEAEVLPDP
jgi:hypothetical protein